MIFKQYYLGCLAHASYLIGDEETQTAIIVDPQRDVDQYVKDAEENGLKIRHVFLTHFHADFVAGHLELRNRTGATIHLGAQAKAEFKFIPHKTGDKLEFKNVRLEILETPGHTPEGISILVYDLIKKPFKPKMVLTGDTLFIGDVGRPDLMASAGITAKELAEMLYTSLREKLMPLPDDTLVYPAHGAGSLCGKNLSEETVSTIGEQKTTNYALQPMRKENFVVIISENQPHVPPYFSYDADLNKKEHLSLDESLKSGLKALTPEEIIRFQNEGCQILDTRPMELFNATHLKGAIGISLDGNFASWCGFLLNPNIPTIIIANPGFEYESELRLGRIGFDQVLGFLEGGMEGFWNHSELIGATPMLSSEYLLKNIERLEGLVILDVRTFNEYKDGHIKNALNIPLNELIENLDKVSQSQNLVVYCEGGYRSGIACSILQNNGFNHLANLLGGFKGIKKTHNSMIETLQSV